jgi:hypothetical protein
MSNPKRDILLPLKADTLRRVVEELELEAKSFREREALIRSITYSKQVTAADILDRLNSAELSAILEHYEYDASGTFQSKKERILEAIEAVYGVTKPSPKAQASAPREPAAERAEPTSSTDQAPDAEAQLLEEYLGLMLNTGRFEDKKVFNFNFCPACKRRHTRKWLSHASSISDFYVCRIGQTRIVHDSDRTTGGHWDVFEVRAYMERYPPEGFSAAVAAVDASPAPVAETTKGEAASPTPPKLEAAPRPWHQAASSAMAQLATHVARHCKVTVSVMPPFLAIEYSMAKSKEKMAEPTGDTTAKPA